MGEAAEKLKTGRFISQKVKRRIIPQSTLVEHHTVEWLNVCPDALTCVAFESKKKSKLNSSLTVLKCRSYTNTH